MTRVISDALYALKLNNDDIVAARLLWVSIGWHPPED